MTRQKPDQNRRAKQTPVEIITISSDETNRVVKLSQVNQPVDLSSSSVATGHGFQRVALLRLTF